MSRPHDVEVGDALAELVDQFADPLVFLRELVQNALDAGSPEVDVYAELRPSGDDPDQGVMVIGVDDYGEGMDRQIIDTRLTRLFSSAKDGDLTKIGKFGIGFVSVFALRPDAVCVDTSRGGEHWRILFRADRSFVRIAREHPVDGTKIQVFKAVTRAEYGDLAARAEKTLRHWCKHVSGTVRWNDDDIAEPFDVPGALCSVRSEAEGIRVVASYLPGGASSFGFYNRGLTLLEGTGSGFIDGVAFKVDSRYLEHTLARNDIMRDANFDKAMAVVEGLAREQLPAALWQRVQQVLEAEADTRSLDAVHRVAARVAASSEVPSQIPLLRAIDGAPLTAAAVRKAAKAGTLRNAEQRSALADAAVAAGVTVVEVRSGCAGTLALLGWLADGEVHHVARTFIMPGPLRDAEEQTRWAPLRAATEALLQAAGVRVAGVVPARFDYAGSCIARRLFVLQREPLSLSPWAEEVVRPAEWKRKDTVVINAAGDGVDAVLTLAQREPELAAYALVKLLHLAVGPLPVEVDAQLCSASAELRATRLSERLGVVAR
ncbi:ATP-binding protein [Paraliomyxa miuraensis]|uniref:ATP-binding protein n=1 Tax=Paraliomyxa miuraensis TaxID=376150 RepID=UPI0022519A6A|nr:ATP-binding protein [Paraliomyxa miuraensis]MCX4242407.1 ATP-binding protein [Paraliomyxa miuraensis]